MEKTILRQLKSSGAIYTTEDCQMSGESNYTFGVTLSKITIKKEEKIISTIREKNIFLKIFCRLLMNFFQLSPYELNYRSQKSFFLRASIISIFPKISGEIENDVFELRLHNNNICSLMKNNVQIAKFKKETKSEFEQNRYTISYSSERDFEICFIFCILMDIQWYKDDTEWAAVRYEKTLVPFDKFSERAYWIP